VGAPNTCGGHLTPTGGCQEGADKVDIFIFSTFWQSVIWMSTLEHCTLFSGAHRKKNFFFLLLQNSYPPPNLGVLSAYVEIFRLLTHKEISPSRIGYHWVKLFSTKLGEKVRPGRALQKNLLCLLSIKMKLKLNNLAC
jgi:hypothetical protein